MGRRTYLAGEPGVVGLTTLAGNAGADAEERTPDFHVDGDGLGVSIDEVWDPVNAGENLEVQFSVGSGDSPTRDVVRLIVGGEIVAAQAYDLVAEATMTDSLYYPTYPVEDDVTFRATVKTHRDQDSREVTVYGTG